MFLFENSLRRDTSSPIPKKHSSCKGTAHGTGKYGCVDEKECEFDRSSIQRNSSKRSSGKSYQSTRKLSENSIETESAKSVEIHKSSLQRNGSARWSLKSNSKKPEKKPTSVSSDNFSESDSLDSLGDKAKSSDTTDDANKKESDISKRLYNGITRSSIAKTAKMRHLDIFDVDDNVWVGGLRKNNTFDEADKKLKQKLLNEIENAFSRNGSLRRKNANQNCDNCDTKYLKDTNQQNGSSKPKVLPSKLTQRGTLKRKSFRFKNFTKAKQISYEEISFMSTNKKTAGLFYVVDKNNCFKELSEILMKKNVQVSTGVRHLLK